MPADNIGMSIGKRIKEARKLAGVTQKDLAKKVGMAQGSLSELETGESNRTTLVGSMAAALGVNALWLETGRGPMRPDDAPAQVSAPQPFDENVRPAPLGRRPIPVISAVQAGALTDMENPYEPGDGYAVEYTDDASLSRWTFGLDVEGTSMTPRFQEGDRLIVDPERAPRPGDFVIARNGTSQATFKKYRPRGIDAQGNEIFELVPLNDDYATLRSDTELLVIIGVVAKVIQNLI